MAGERLAAARRELQISVDEVAKELHLDEPKVRALEENRFETLGAPVFAKGHLRKYALLVGISVDEAIAEYEALNQTPEDPPVVGRVRKVPREIAAGPWIAVLLVAALAAAAYWWFVVRAPATVPALPAAPTAATETAPPAAVAERPASESASEAEIGDGAADDTAPAAAEPADVEPRGATETAPPADGSSTLTVRFSGDCWTEITDARGERLFFALGREGRRVNVVGQPPFSVVFGDADNVSLAVDGEPYAIPAANRSGRMARLTIVAR